MRKIRIEHVTEYEFGAPVLLQPHRGLLRPRESHAVRVAASKLEITPEPTVRWQRDVLDNSVVLMTFPPEHVDRLRIHSEVLIEHHEKAPLDFVVDAHAVHHPFNYLAAEGLVLAPFRAPSWPGEDRAVEDWLRSLSLGRDRVETYVLIDRLNRAIHDSFAYQAREAEGVQSPSTTLNRRVGSCRDFATLFVEGCRALGLASRFVSGYLHAPPSEAGEGATHAWAEVYLPGPGWKGFDPTTGELAGKDHIPVAVAHHPEKVPPVSGAFLGPDNAKPVLHVKVTVTAEDGSLPASAGATKRTDLANPS